MKRISVEYSIEETHVGREYKGNITMNGSQFEYRLWCNVHLDDIHKVQVTCAKDVLDRFPVFLKKHGVAIHSTQEVDLFLLKVLLPAATDFYNSPQQRSSKEGYIGAIRDGDRMHTGLKVSVSMTGACDFDISEEFAEMLSAPEFGCTFP